MELKQNADNTLGTNRPNLCNKLYNVFEKYLLTPVGLERVVRLEARVAAGFLRSDVDGVVRVVQDGIHRITAGGGGRPYHSTSREAQPCAREQSSYAGLLQIEKHAFSRHVTHVPKASVILGALSMTTFWDGGTSAVHLCK